VDGGHVAERSTKDERPQAVLHLARSDSVLGIVVLIVGLVLLLVGDSGDVRALLFDGPKVRRSRVDSRRGDGSDDSSRVVGVGSGLSRVGSSVLGINGGRILVGRKGGGDGNPGFFQNHLSYGDRSGFI
jgi:hypothetical protein